MRTLLVAALPLLLLAGCTKSVSEMNYSELKAYAGQMADKCKRQGVPQNEMQACISQEARADQARRANQRRVGAAIAAGSQAYGQSVQANRPVNCTSTGVGNMVRTTCY